MLPYVHMQELQGRHHAEHSSLHQQLDAEKCKVAESAQALQARANKLFMLLVHHILLG